MPPSGEKARLQISYGKLPAMARWTVVLAVLILPGPVYGDDLTLRDALDAVSAAPAAQVGEHEVDAAEALTDAAGAWPAPSLHVDTNRLTARVVAGASLPLPLFGTIGTARRDASARATIARSEAGLAIRDVRRQVALAWLALARAEGEATAGAEAARQAAELERIARGKRDAGGAGGAQYVGRGIEEEGVRPGSWFAGAGAAHG